MVRREGRLLLITCAANEQDEENVLWMDIAYDQVIQLPLAWPVWRYVLGSRMSRHQKSPSTARLVPGRAGAPGLQIHPRNGVSRGMLFPHQIIAINIPNAVVVNRVESIPAQGEDCEFTAC